MQKRSLKLLKLSTPIQKWRIQYDYRHQSIIDKLKNDFILFEYEATYLENVTLEIGIPNEMADHVIQKLYSFKHLFIKSEQIEDSFHIQE